MILYKHFLVKICAIENVSVPELMALTGKSQAVVYSWLDLSKPECFPLIDSLGKILFRLGMTFDDFINCKHPIYESGEMARVYYLYIHGAIDQRCLGNEILELPHSVEVIKTYLVDRMLLCSMAQDYVRGHEIDKNRFDFLCKALAPAVLSDSVEFGVQTIFELNSYSLDAYKLGADSLCEYRADCEQNGIASESWRHEILFPDAAELVLLLSDKDIGLLKTYLSMVEYEEICDLFSLYRKICTDHPEYDKKGKILKILEKNRDTCTKEVADTDKYV